MTTRFPSSRALALLLAVAAPFVAAQTAPRLVDRVVAVVNTEAITELELAQRERSVAQRARTQGIPLPPAAELRRQVLDRMVLDRAMLQAARDAGIRADEASIDRAIARIAQDANLTVPQLRERLESEGSSFAIFRQEISSEITIARIREREIDARVQVSEAEIDAALAAQEDGAAAPPEFNILQVLVRVPEDASAEVVETARQRAEAIARDLRAGADPARVLAELSELSEQVSGGPTGMRGVDRLPPLFVQAVESLAAGQVAGVVRSPAGFHVLKLIERRGGAAGKIGGAPVRQTRARHILIRINEINPEPEVVRRLTEIRGRIEGGTVSFADMARQYSVDGSASQGGDLGWVYPGDTVPEFERAMDALDPGQIAGPVRSPFGYHLIQVVERRTDEASPDRVRAATRNVLRERKAAEAYQEWVSQVRDRAYVDIRLDER